MRDEAFHHFFHSRFVEGDFEFGSVDAANGAVAKGLMRDALADLEPCGRGRGATLRGGDFADFAFDLDGWSRRLARRAELPEEVRRFLAPFALPAAWGNRLRLPAQR